MANIDERKKEEMQSRFTQLQMLDQQLKAMQQQMQMLEKQVLEMGQVEEALDDFKKVDEGEEILVPISAGVYAKGSLKDNKKFLVNVGGQIAVEKSVDEVKAMITHQKNELEKMQKEMAGNTQKLAEEGMKLQEEIAKIM